MEERGRGYKNHHYVPQWYQRRFTEGSVGELHYLTLNPVTVLNGDGNRRTLPQQRRQSIRRCFAEDDLYTVRFGEQMSTRIEREFFGQIDNRGAEAVAWWAKYDLAPLEKRHLHGLLAYMTTQKLRTPKGLDWLRSQLGVTDQNRLLDAVTRLRTLYATIWVESVWQLADATSTDTKFIVTDHPVTVYNRACGPRHESCRGANDPDVRWHASHTLFPLGLDRIVILTNRSWVENPYRPPRELRPNPSFYRETMFNYFDVHVGRALTEEEVLHINFILKQRAYRFVAAAREEWLFPEQHVSKKDWTRFGNGYLLMPDPREVHAGGEMVLGFDDGSTEAYDSFGHRPWDPGYIGVAESDSATLRRFQDEFTGLFGQAPRGEPFGRRFMTRRPSEEH